MQRNGAAPMFCFFLCFWGSCFGLTELIQNIYEKRSLIRSLRASVQIRQE